MEEYLLQHNVTMSDFWGLLFAWVFGVVLLFFLWRSTIKLYQTEKKYGHLHNYITWIGSSALTIVFGPAIVMGAWHFINMVTTLLWNFNLY